MQKCKMHDAGSWKMNLNAAQSQELIDALKAQTFNASPYFFKAP